MTQYPRTAFAIIASLAVSAPLFAQQAPPPDRTAYAYARDSAFAHPTNRGTIAFTLPTKDLLAENVAYDPRDRSFYVGSTRHGSIVRRAADGTITDFVPGGRDGMWMVIGMKVDARRGWLWVNSAGGSNYVRHTAADEGRSALFRYDLRTGRLLKRYAVADTGQHFLNDLVLADDGTVYLTNMLAGAIYTVAPGADSLVLWTRPQGLTFPNGIALSADGRTLFVPSREGINAIDVGTRERRVLPVADSIDVRGIDGLYWHQGALIGVQGGRRNRVQRFTLAPGGDRITGATVLEAHHPMFMNPTTGVVVGDDIYVVANSQFDSISETGTLLPRERLFETVILRIPIRD
jgi:sugar lactone lactonase YvrE